MRIQGVEIRPMNVHSDPRGNLYEILRSDEPMFRGFGQAYVLRVFKGERRGGHYHRFMWDFFAPVVGLIDVILLDIRPGPTCGHSERFTLDAANPKGILVPPMVWHRIDSRFDEGCHAIGISSLPYDPGKPDKHVMEFEEAVKKAGQNTIHDHSTDELAAGRGIRDGS